MAVRKCGWRTAFWNFSPIAYASHAHCRLNRVELNGNWSELEQVAKLHAANLQSVTNWVQSCKRRAIDQSLAA
jgi:hypothetical protein